MTHTSASRRLLSSSIVLALLLVFGAPWGALCAAADAPGHQMPCCSEDGSAPLIRPCCAMDTDRSARTVPVESHAIAPVQPLHPIDALPAVNPSRRAAPAALPTRPIGIRLLTSVFQI